MVLEQTDRIAADSPSLFAALADRARGLSTLALVATSLCVWLAIALWTIPDETPWPLPLPILTIGCFGLWGILERLRIDRASRSYAFKFTQLLVATIGVISASAAIFAVVGILMGEFIL